MRKNPKIFASAIAALVLCAGTALLPLTSGLAQDTPAASVSLVENADRTASTYSRENTGIVVAVRLGTAASTPDPSTIENILRSEFVKAGIADPITFFFDRHDVAGTAVAFYYSGDVDGPFSLGASREEAKKTAKTYNFRKSKGLL